MIVESHGRAKGAGQVFLAALILITLIGLTGCRTGSGNPSTLISQTSVNFPNQSEPPVNLPQYSLAIYLEHPYPGDSQVDYRKNPIAITGWVNLTDASVAVNEVAATVESDGNYYAFVQLKEGVDTLQAVASLGDKTDEMTYMVGVDSKGRLYTVPGLGGGGSNYFSRLDLPQSIELEAGERKPVDFKLEVKKDIRGSADLLFRAYSEGPYGPPEFLQLPDGLYINIDPPPHLTAYANTAYSFRLQFDAATNTKPGKYPVPVEYAFENGPRASSTINVTIDPAGTRPISELPITTQCQAAAIAKAALPPSILSRIRTIGAEISGIAPDQRCFVDIILDPVTGEELGWAQGPAVQFDPGAPPFDVKDSYNLLIISIDVKTGEIINKKATNGLVTGYPSFWVTCP